MFVFIFTRPRELSIPIIPPIPTKSKHDPPVLLPQNSPLPNRSYLRPLTRGRNEKESGSLPALSRFGTRSGAYVRSVSEHKYCGSAYTEAALNHEEPSQNTVLRLRD